MYTATHCNTLQHTATCGQVKLQSAELRGVYILRMCRLQHVQHSTTHCNTLQHVARWNLRVQKYTWGVRKSTLQHTATNCNKPQHSRTCGKLRPQSTELRGLGEGTQIQLNGHDDCLLLFAFGQIQSAKYVCARVFVRVRVWVWVWVWVTYNQLNRR